MCTETQLQGCTDFKTSIRDLLFSRISSCLSSNQSQYQTSPHWKGCWLVNSVVKTSVQHREVWYVSCLRIFSHLVPILAQEPFYFLLCKNSQITKKPGNTCSTTMFEEKVCISLYTPIQGRSASVFVPRSINWSLVPFLKSASKFQEDVACSFWHAWHAQM